MQSGEVCVRVLYNFDYTTKDGRLVSIRQSEKLLLLKRTNKDWWQVRRDADTKPFYVPAAYVRQIPPAFIPVPKHEYTNMPAGPACCHEERRQLTSVLRNELITGNYNLRADKQLFNQHVCPAADKEPATGVRRNYSVVGPTGKKRPVPSPRQLSKSLETLAEEIQFRPWTQHDKSCEQTSDYNTPSPDYLDSPCCEQDMFWKKINLQSSAGDNSVQRSSSFKFRSFRRNNNVQPPAQFEDSSDSVASRSLESLVDSGAEACSSSSYEWDKSPGEDNLAEVMRRVSIPHAALAFKNQTYQSTDDEDSDVDDGATVVRTRPRSSSDTGLTQEQSKKESSHLSRSESHRVFNKEQPKPLIALKRNPKLVGCRRRPALLCLPTKSSSLEDDDDYLYDETPRGRKRPPKTPPSPAPHEKPLRVLPGGWAEFYCSDAGGQGRLYYFHAITGLKSWKPPRTKRIGYDGNVSDKSDGELRSGKRSPKEGTKSRSPSPAPSDLVLPPGWEEHYDRDEHQAFFIHKPTGAKAQHLGRDPQLPGNVSEWLQNLRRNTDSSEVEDELRHKVESAAAASGITTGVAAPRLKSLPPSKPEIVNPKPEISRKPKLKKKPSLKEVHPPSAKMDCSSASDKEHGGWKANPLFQGIEPPQIRRQDSSDAPTSFRTLCDEARRASLDLLKEMPSDLSADSEPAADDDDDDAKDDEEPEEPPVDDDLDKLTEQALSLVDEALIEHAVNKRLNVPRMRNNSVGSDLSDEVFLSCNSDMNCIFDHDGANTNPVPPPRRKKKSPVEENPAENMGQIVKQIQILTSKAMSEGEEPNFKRSASLKKKPPEPMTAPPCDFVSELLPFKSKEQLIKKQNRASAPPLSTGAMPKKCAPPSPREPPPSIDAPKQKPPSPNTQPPTPLERKSSLKKENKPEVHKPVYSQQFSVQFVERKTYYPEITRDSVVLVPAVSQEMRDLIADETMAAQDEEDEQSEEQISLEESFRSRKGSNGSDIVAWKQDLRSRSNADEEEETFFSARSAPHPEWLSSSDSEGRVYFFAENSNDSTWSLPKTPAAPKGSPPLPGSASPPKTSTPLPRVAPQGVPPVLKRLELQLQQTADESSPTDENDTPGLYRPRKNMGPCLLPPLPNSRTAKSQSMHVPDIKTPMTDCSVDTSGPWASLENTGVTILKEGLVSRTKVMESGKKVKKNWAQGWALLTDDCMYFFKDEKSFKLMRNESIGHPELCIRLLNSTFGEADKSMSSKKNAFIIGNSTTQLLCQEDQIREQDSWFNQISVAKKSLPENHLNTAPRVPVISREASPNPPATQNHRMGSASPEIHKSNSLNRSKSVKMKKDVAESNEDLTSQDSQKNIRAGLKKFFKRRPTMETLVKKGIWKDEPAFGSTLKKLCEDRSPGPNPKIPKFVYECIKAIEKKPENLKTDGIYRASGNLSQVQKIRLQVDQNNLEILDQEEEVHVLTGALKLFFRELKEPLIPFDAFQKSLFASSVGDKLERSRLFREIIQNLPKENHDTLKFLLEHLLRVVANQTFNRMDIGNLSIVFGPTLMWPEQESLDCMAVDLMRQNNVIVCLLHEFDSIFN